MVSPICKAQFNIYVYYILKIKRFMVCFTNIFQILHQEILQHNWVEDIEEGDSVTRHVVSPSPSNEANEVTISSAVLDLCRKNEAKLVQVNDCTKLEHLGSGGFGDTFKFTSRAARSNLDVSVVIKENKIKGERGRYGWADKPAWYREVRHAMNLSHDNIIKYLGKVVLYKSSYFCIMEDGGISLHGKYKSRSEMSTSDIRTAMCHIASAVNYLHQELEGERLIIHRDIRACNVTVSDGGVYKLIDFGISSQKTQENSMIYSDMKFGNALWKSPEFYGNHTSKT